MEAQKKPLDSGFWLLGYKGLTIEGVGEGGADGGNNGEYFKGWIEEHSNGKAAHASRRREVKKSAILPFLGHKLYGALPESFANQDTALSILSTVADAGNRPSIDS